MLLIILRIFLTKTIVNFLFNSFNKISITENLKEKEIIFFLIFFRFLLIKISISHLYTSLNKMKIYYIGQYLNGIFIAEDFNINNE